MTIHFKIYREKTRTLLVKSGKRENAHKIHHLSSTTWIQEGDHTENKGSISHSPPCFPFIHRSWSHTVCVCLLQHAGLCVCVGLEVEGGDKGMQGAGSEL